MQIFYNLLTPHHHPTIGAISIGIFDGLHLGHKQLLKQLLYESAPLDSAIITFSNHPANFINKQNTIGYIMSLKHKEKLLCQMGINYLFHIPFSAEIQNQTASQFIAFLKKSLNPKCFLAGYDTKIGSDKLSFKELLAKLFNDQDIAFKTSTALMDKNSIISSTNIRRAISNNQLHKVSQMLGRPYSLYIKIQLHTSDQFHSYMLEQENLLLPPEGFYETLVKFEGTENYVEAIVCIKAQTLSGTLKSSTIIINQPIYTEIFFDTDAILDTKK